MNIVINRSNAEARKLKKTLWKKFSFKAYLLISLLILTGLSLLFSKINKNGSNIPFWNFVSAFGLSFVIIGLIRFLDLTKKRQIYVRHNLDSSTILIDDKCISIATKDAEFKLFWQYFKFYQFKGSIIIFQKDLSLLNTVVINKDELTEDEISFLQNMIFQYQLIKI